MSPYSVSFIGSIAATSSATACRPMIDHGVGRILAQLRPNDFFIITGDHGNDPTIGHDKHTREFTALLVAGHRIAPHALAPRESVADIPATSTEIFEVRQPEIGRSFLKVQRTPSAAASAAVAMAR